MEGYIVTGSKLVEIGKVAEHDSYSLYLVVVCLKLNFSFSSSHLALTGTKLSEDSRKYGAENTCTSGTVLSKAALSYSRAYAQIEMERENLLKALGTQVWLIISHTVFDILI